MLGKDPFYWGIFRKTIIGFGNLFKDVEILRKDQAGTAVQTVKVPLTYAQKAPYLARILQQPNIEKQTFEIVLPRMSFEIDGFYYDASRKLNQFTKNTLTSTTGKALTMGNGVPYNMELKLYIYVKNQEDGLQMIEQILPFFGPSVNLSLEMVPDAGIVQNVPVILNQIDYEDDYEGDFNHERVIIYTLSFTAQTVLYGPIDGISDTQCGYGVTDASGVIKQVIVNVDAGSPNAPSGIGTMTTQVNPLSANKTDNYTIEQLFSGDL